ncbi:hypothetical protein [Zoogloea dura]|jgi:hypothetical protein|uniref:Uncharacterized protein n=1 Tax=Zoogloea dura TaxID=2728840 RepID=A0A848G380_9RHOO|nr:hypothetical protein [Zoogloea dura]NML25682.1 hypothetical protein [Zoogloea dura]
MRKIALPLVLALLSAQSPAEEIPFQDLSRRNTHSIAFRTDTFTVARSEAELNAIWPDSVAAARRGDRQRFPIKVPFDREMVIAAVLATHSNGCTGVRITRVISEKDRLVTHYQRDHYPGNTLCPAAMTTAFHLVTVPVSKLPVVFVEEADNTPAD